MGIVSRIKEEFRVIQERDPAIKSPMEVLLYPSFQVMLRYRIAHKLYLKKHYFLARWISQRAARKTGIEIHPGAVIGRRCFIDHGMGVIIGETAEVGDDVTIYQGVTLGGTGKDTGKRHPTIGNRVVIASGAKVLGPFTVGDDVKIGSGSVVLKEVPSGCTVVGIPGTIVKRYGKSTTQDMNQVDLPDPVAVEIECLRRRIVHLEQIIRQMHETEEKSHEETCTAGSCQPCAEECREDIKDENL